MGHMAHAEAFGLAIIIACYVMVDGKKLHLDADEIRAFEFDRDGVTG